MLSSDDLENIIASKKREIEKEKELLGLVLSPKNSNAQKENDEQVNKSNKQLQFKENDKSEKTVIKERRILCENQQNETENKEENYHKTLYQLEENIPPDLERYIRRYIGLPVMLKAGEYSPNNPLLRGDRAVGGDALLGLGEYERRRNTLRKIRQAQYRQYLDQQAKKKQEAKEQAEQERREREEKERQREERERQLLLERDRYSPERRRASVSSVPISNAFVQTTKVDTGVQVEGVTTPLSVAVQTDDVELYRLSPSPSKCLTQAERELSPRTVADPRDSWNRKWDSCERRRSYGDFDERTCTIKKTNRDKLVSDLRHTYMPSIFDADAIQMRNLQAEKEAVERRQFYQQELKNQILEQQRIREERKSREKMLEQAEMRRLEEQLRMLRVAQDREIDKQRDISAAMKDNARDYESKRTALQKEIDMEQQKLLRSTSQPNRYQPKRFTCTSKSDSQRSKPSFQPIDKHFQQLDNNFQLPDNNFQTLDKKIQPIDKKPYSFNIPDNSVFSANYDVDSYLRKNLNFRDKIDLNIQNIGNNNQDRNVIIEKALIHEPKESKMEKTKVEDLDNISIPVLRHSPKLQENIKETTNLSAAMKKIDDKWKVPAVQKNILKTLPSEDGKSISILTQLGSIRRQLQLEQLKLDKMLSKEDK